MAILLRRGFIPSGGGPVNPETTTWVNNVFAVDGTVVGATQTAQVDSLITALKSSGVFTTWDAIWLLCCDNLTETTVDIVNGKIYTVGAGIRTLTTSGSSGGINMSTNGWLNTGFSPTTLTQYAQGSGTIAVYVTVADTNNQVTPLGMNGSTQAAFFVYQTSPSRVGGNVNSINGDWTPKATHSNGNWIFSRTGLAAGNEAGLIFDASTPAGDVMGATGDAAQTLQNFNFYIFAQNQSNTAGSNFAGTLSMAAIGAGLNSTQQTNFASAINTYMTARTCNVY
jgi:hypothetical protein